MSTEAPEVLLSHYLKALKLPTLQREYQKLAMRTEGSIMSDISHGYPSGR